MNIQKHTLARFLIASSIALGVSLSAHANPMMDGVGQGPGGHMGMHGMSGPGMQGMDHMPRFLHGLNLSEAQRDKIFELMHAQMPAMREKAKGLHKAHMELRQLEMSPDYNEAKVKALTEANAKTMAEMAQMRARTAHAIYQMLTPEQRKQIDEMKSRPASRGMGKGGFGPGMGRE